jgi:hypothetical protein
VVELLKKHCVNEYVVENEDYNMHLFLEHNKEEVLKFCKEARDLQFRSVWHVSLAP